MTLFKREPQSCIPAKSLFISRNFHHTEDIRGIELPRQSWKKIVGGFIQNSLVPKKEGEFHTEFISYSCKDVNRGIELPGKNCKKRGGSFIQN